MSTPRPGGTRFATRGNSRIAYDPGAPADPDSPTIVMLHSLLADRSAFAAQREALGERYRIIAPDARGHGASATLANQWYTVGELAQDVLAILDAEGITQVHLVGHELGGVTGLELARRAPNRVASLMLIEPAVASILDIDSAPDAAQARTAARTSDREVGDAAYKGLTDTALDGYLIPRWGPNWRQVISTPRFGAVRRHAGALAGIIPALDSFTVDRADFRAISVPALLVIGEDATPLARVTAERLATLLPDARTEMVHLGSRPNNPFGGDAAAPINALVTSQIEATTDHERKAQPRGTEGKE
ncbi:MAG: alpha/beta fold hydrolase [Thermomicrobiales bacterium]